MKRYTEREYSEDIGSFKDWVQHAAALLLAAPLRLVNEISTKVVYLDRKLIGKILNLAAIIAVISTALTWFLKIMLGDSNVWLGKVPLALQIIVSGIMLCITVWFHLWDFTIYRKMEALRPVENLGKQEELSTVEEQQESNPAESEEKTKPVSFKDFDREFLESLEIPETPTVTPKSQEKMSIKDIADSLIKASDSKTEKPVQSNLKSTQGNFETDLDDIDEELLSLLNEDLVADPELTSYRKEIETAVDDMDAIDEGALQQEMDDSTDPSKYVSEDSILRFLTDLGAESVGTADMLDGWKLPDSFDMTA